MTMAANSSSSVVELNQQVIELKQAITQAVQNKADVNTVNRMQTQLDALDLKLAEKHVGGVSQKSIFDLLREDESVQKILRDRKGRAFLKFEGAQASAIMQQKNIISAVTSGSSGGDPLNPVGTMITGVLPIDRIPGITAEARQVLKVRDVLSARPTTMQVVDFVRVLTPLSIASPVPEASVKPENQMTFQSLSERVKLLATWIPATRQVLEDLTELQGFITSSLPYYVNLAEELQILAGDNIGEDWHGLLPQASTLNTALLPAAAQGYNRIDMIAAAIEEINIAKEVDPTFIIVNPSDWWRIRLTKDGFGRYILGDPQTTVRPNIFGLDVVATTSIPAGTFLVGSGNPAAAELRDRMSIEVEISTEHASFFTQNLIAIRAEKRGCLVVKRPASFCTGQFVTSPVS